MAYSWDLLCLSKFVCYQSEALTVKAKAESGHWSEQERKQRLAEVMGRMQGGGRELPERLLRMPEGL